MCMMQWESVNRGNLTPMFFPWNFGLLVVRSLCKLLTSRQFETFPLSYVKWFTSVNIYYLQQVFRTPLTGYNVLIHLTKKHVPLAALAVDVAVETGSTHTRNSSQKDPTHFPVTDFNPVEKYLAELEVSLTRCFICISASLYHYCNKHFRCRANCCSFQRAYSEFCLFFYDKYGGRCIAVVWKPQAFSPQPFKVRTTVQTRKHSVPLAP